MNTCKRLRKLTLALFAALIAAPGSVWADGHNQTSGMRAEAMIVEAVVLAIDHATREASLELPFGNIITLTVGPEVKRLAEIDVGDRVIATYLTSLAGEVREPTAEEKAEPWVVLEGEAAAPSQEAPGRVGFRSIRALCTIEGMNRVTRTVMIEDPMGRYHMIGEVAPERMENVTLGTQVIITYTEAVALSLDKIAAQ